MARQEHDEAEDWLLKDRDARLDTRSPNAEHRKHPRFTIESGSVKVSMEPLVSVVDVSVSGMAFRALQPFTKGHSITIAVPNVFTVEAEVVLCQMLEDTSSHFMEAYYRVHCKFADEELGKHLLVLLNEPKARRG